jgi:hypothetical protein
MATVRIQVRRGTASQWTSTNPILAAGEMGVETDTNKFKFGNGTATWSALSYANADTAGITEISQDAINAALTMGTGLTKTYNDGANTITIAIDDTVWANKAYVTAAVNALSNTVDTTYIQLDDRGAANGVASLNAQGKVPTSETDLTVMATRAYAEYLQTQDLLAVDTHAAKTTSVHGIPDTAQIATLTNVASARTDLNAAIVTKFNESKTYTDAEIDTTVAYVDTKHGIAMAAATSAESNAATYSDNKHGIAMAAATSAQSNAAIYSDNKSTQDRTFTTSAVSAHEADTTSVHGIADTTALATKSYADTAASTAQTAATSAASSALATHEADTTNVHGIADTSALALTATVNSGLALKAPLASPTFTGTVSGITKTMVGLGNADNTADSAKPISTAAQEALDLKAPLASPTFTGTVALPSTTSIGDVSATELGYLDGVTSAIQTQITAKAPLASPALTGTPTAPTAAAGTNTTQVATTQFVGTAVSALVAAAPAALDTLNELATALGNDASFSTTVTNSIALKAPLASPTFTGTVILPAGTVTSGMILDGTIVDADINASAAIAQSKISGLSTSLGLKANLADPTFTGTVTVGAAGVAFTDGTQTKEGVPSRTPISQKSAAYTLSALSERDNLIEVSSASAVAVTIPADSTLNYPIGTSIDILQTGVGQVSIAGASGVTVNATPGLKLRTQWSSASLLKRAANTWIVMGDLSA